MNCELLISEPSNMLKLYNTLTRKKETFKPLKNRQVGIYTCGPTVYNHAHIGNLRAYVVADILQRYLKYNGYKVKWVMNITDVDDKTIRDSKKVKKSLKDFTRYYEKIFFDDISKLNIDKKDLYKYPRATEHIKDMQEIIKKLLRNEVAYKKNGSIYFSIQKYIEVGHKYGQLLKIDLKRFKGERVELDEYEKEDIKDFSLWKKTKKGEPSWDFIINNKNYPGRPGWHIECSAMSSKYLGQPFDIHTGGVDLIFPHHEDEIAQSEGATGKPLAKFFVHNEHLLVNGHKMSKSLGNFYTLEDVMKMVKNPLALRYLFLQAHYRSKLDFTKASIRGAERTLEAIYDLIVRLKEVNNTVVNIAGIRSPVDVDKHIRNTKKSFFQAMENDINTPLALSRLFIFIHAIGSDQDVRNYTIKEARKILTFLYDIDKIFGLGFQDVKEEKLPANIQKLIDEREKARAEKDFKKADVIREKTLKLGFELEDTPQGVRWKRVR